MSPPENPINTLVLVHGLWFRTSFMRVLARRLGRAGFAVLSFNYRSTRQPLDISAEQLRDFCAARAPGGAHLVGHSLGGLLILRMLVQARWDAPGRLLFLGTPLLGSAVARRAHGWPGGGQLFGHAQAALQHGLQSQGGQHWPADREVGLIAGTRAFGLGVLTGGVERPNDGAVAVSETRHPGLTDRIELPVTHTGMLFSQEVANRAVRFLRLGRFG